MLPARDPPRYAKSLPCTVPAPTPMKTQDQSGKAKTLCFRPFFTAMGAAVGGDWDLATVAVFPHNGSGFAP